jgi:hypothetical protein
VNRLVDLIPRTRSVIVERFTAGDTIALLAWDYDCHELTVEYVVREAMRGGKKKRKGGRR